MNSAKLFRASCVALIVTAMSFILRGAANASWAMEFHLSQEQVGWVDLTAFWGFTAAMMLGGPLCDAFGLGKIVAIAFVGHVAGILLTMFAWDFWSLFFGTLIFGVANGSVEAACNPLIATLYPTDKTTKLNHFHAWFPGGQVIGGLLAVGLQHAGYGWKIQFACMLIPLVAYGIMFLGQKYPQTERVQQGVSTGGMWLACLNPLFLLMVACMWLTAATELGPGQWIPSILENAGVSGTMVLVWITGLMWLGRQCAGAFVHRLSPAGVLLVSSILSAVGLYAIAHTTGPMLFASATVFAMGVCFYWPTMLGFVSERFPATGALGLAIMGGCGMLSAGLILPIIGRRFDAGIASRLGTHSMAEYSAAAPGTPLAAEWMNIKAQAGLETLGKVAILPVILTVVFLLIYLSQRKKTPTVPVPTVANV